MTVLTEYLTNAALLKTFAWLEAVNLFLPSSSTSAVSSVNVSRLYSYISPKDTRHTRLFSLCTRSRPLWFWQNKHWNFPLFFFSPAKEWWAHIGYSILGLAGCSGFGRFLTLNWCIQSEHMGVLFYTTGESGVKMTTKGTCCCPHTQAWW